MEFNCLKLDEIRLVVKYKPDILTWKATHRKTHIIGIQSTGNYRHIIGRRELYLRENTVFFLNRKDDYAVTCLQKGESFSIHFTTFGEIDTDSFCMQVRDGAPYIRLLEEIERSYLSGRQGSIFAAADFYRLCGLLELAAKNPLPSDNGMEEARRYMDLHYADRDCVAGACRLRGVTERRFNDLFRSCYHTTPHRYLTESRLAHAKELLKIPELSVGGVAELCGFSDLYYFSRKFREQCGCSPTEYRRQL